MNLTNVATTVIGPPAYRALDRDGKDQGHTPLGEPDDVQEMEILMGQGIVWRTEERQRAPAHLWPAAIRDWHALLIELVNLKSDRPLVADWLNRAGYAARLARMAPKGRRTLATPPMDPMPESVLPLLDPHDAFLWGPLPRMNYREFQKRLVINF